MRVLMEISAAPACEVADRDFGHLACRAEWSTIASMARRPRQDPMAPVPPSQARQDADLDDPGWRLRGHGCWIPLYCSSLPLLLAGAVAALLAAVCAASRSAR